MKTADYSTVVADQHLESALRDLVRLGTDEDLADQVDWTTLAIVPPDSRGRCRIMARHSGTAAGIVTIPWIIDALDLGLTFEPHIEDGQQFEPSQSLGLLEGNVRELLTAERLILNIVSRLCGVATLTASYVARLEGSGARLYDTRKTTTGWRLLEKYAVHCGGGHNHRRGLFDGFLIKDNHLALAGTEGTPLSPAEAVRRARAMSRTPVDGLAPPHIVEVEVDSLEQLRDVLPADPDIVLVDNFTVAQLREAVELRDQLNPTVELEASGGVTIDAIAAIAATGVERISCGALTHQAVWLDLGLDWAP